MKENSAIRATLRVAAFRADREFTRYGRHVKAVYERVLGKGKSKMEALEATTRKAVPLCFGVLKNQAPDIETLDTEDFASAF